MKKYEFSKMKLGEVDFLHCAKLKTFARIKKSISDFNRNHTMTISHRELGGGIEVRRVA